LEVNVLYQIECDTLEGEQLRIPVSTLAAAKQRARRLSRKHIVTYAVAFEDGKAVGHIVYGEGFKCETQGKLWECD
jgi:hypothetical protein